jgi:hypothetical protein
LLSFGFHLLLDSLLYYSSGSGFSVFDSDRAARRRSTLVFLCLPPLFFSPSPLSSTAGHEKQRGETPTA